MRLKVMTFNIRYDTPADGINAFAYRREAIVRFLRREAPDIVGFQESVHSIRTYLAEALPDYAFLAVDLGDPLRNDVPIAYRKDTLDLLNLSQFWLSPTPDLPNTRYKGGSPFDRMATLATLVTREGRRSVTLLNSHLDHISSEARERGAALLLERLTPYLDTPCFLTGDFNATPEAREVRILSECPRLRELTAPLAPTVATYHGYGRISESFKIDYIFSSLAATPIEGSLRMHTDEEGGIYLSDHYPLSVEVEI